MRRLDADGHPTPYSCVSRVPALFSAALSRHRRQLAASKLHPRDDDPTQGPPSCEIACAWPSQGGCRGVLIVVATEIPALVITGFAPIPSPVPKVS
jgi:hypothetical protein